jgi:hypothetical protein
MINFASKDRQRPLSQLQQKDEQINFLSKQVNRLTKLLTESGQKALAANAPHTPGADQKVIQIASRHRAKAGP